MSLPTSSKPEFRRQNSRRLLWGTGGLDESLREALWTDPADVHSNGTSLRQSGFRQTVQLQGGGQRLVMKHYREPRKLHSLKRAFLPSRAHATWSVTYRLAALGVATPLPLAVVENRLGPLRRDSYLVYPYLPGETLRQAIVRHTTAGTDDRLAPFWDQLEALWGILRQHRISLSDANTGNFIVTPSGRLAVIDLDGTRFYRSSLVAKWYQRQTWQQVKRSAAKAVASAQKSQRRAA